MREPLSPSLYQINARVWLTELSRALGRPATLDDIPDAELDRVAGMGFDWVWLLSVWRTGPAGQRVSRDNRDWRREFEETLPDLREEDIAGSGFAITGYTVHPGLGGDAALARLRGRLRQRGLRLMLDFVPNHTGLDHPWVEDHPEYFVPGTELDLTRAPQNYTWVKRTRGDLLLAHGRDPYFPGWPDTLQLDYNNPATQEAMIGELLRIAGQCDGVRCDMAMLVLPDVFERTWGRRAPLFWPEANLATRGPCAVGTRRRNAAAVLRRSPGGAPAAGRSRRRVAPAPMRASLGRQRDVGWLHRMVVGDAGRPAAGDRRQLCREPEPVLRPFPVSRLVGPRSAAQGSDGSRQLRSRRNRPRVTGALSRLAPVELPRIRGA